MLVLYFDIFQNKIMHRESLLLSHMLINKTEFKFCHYEFKNILVCQKIRETNQLRVYNHVIEQLIKDPAEVQGSLLLKILNSKISENITRISLLVRIMGFVFSNCVIFKIDLKLAFSK